jgi:hypothetical protein
VVPARWVSTTSESRSAVLGPVIAVMSDDGRIRCGHSGFTDLAEREHVQSDTQSADIYDVVESMPEICEALVIGVN